MTIKEIIKRPEGRRLEFKEVLPEYADLAKTIVAFANDAGGELYIGVQNNPREIVGLPEEELMKIEEQVSSIIFDRCYPAVLPEITFLTDDDKLIEHTIKDNKNHPDQKIRISKRGILFLELLKK
jgi:predicted HTH transcriptional regulator